jgi:hypothetical protein
MSLSFLPDSLPALQLLLRCAAWIVPSHERAEWLAEWQGELWHAWHMHGREGPSCSSGGRAATVFCLGAFSDALWLRRNNRRSRSRRLFRTGSASRCSILLGTWTAVSLLLCLLLPGARKAIQLSLSQQGDSLVTISGAGYSGTQVPTIRVGDYQSWADSKQRVFTEIAFYQPLLKRVHLGNHPDVALSINRASDNIFKLLSLPAPARTSDRSASLSTAKLFLSEGAWHELFESDPRVIGSVTEIAGQRTVVAGVVSQNPWQVPGRVDAWLLEDGRQLALLPPDSRGFVLAHLRTSGAAEGWGYMHLHRSDGSETLFDCISLAQCARLPFSIFLLTFIAALAALPATTALPLGEYPRHAGHLRWAERARQWIFLCGKFVLVVPLVSLAAVDIAYGVPTSGPMTGEYVQLALSFLGFLFGFRWILQDQRKRCPTCLRVLSNPARVGEASRNFLAWNGIELICADGHGLLHIPELPTSWFSTQRWLYLDASWDSLFPDSQSPSFV